MTSRPFRSVLYMPGSNPRALEKAKTLPADALIFDLEDAVSPEKKLEARAQVVASAKEALEGAYGERQILIRTNDLDTQWGEDDLRAVAATGVDGILLPKVNGAGNILRALEILQV